MLHGADDLTCPVGQAQQWHTSLRERGVPTELVLYPGASHVFILLGPPSHRLDYNRRVVDWVEQYAVARPAGPRIDAAHWERRLARARRAARRARRAARHPAPRRRRRRRAASRRTACSTSTPAQPATTDSVFQIGSITKVWTATVVMQLVDEGLLDLDAPVVEVLPELRLADPDVTKQVTMRHLLTHTSGIDGDVFTDTGRGDDCLEKYVDAARRRRAEPPARRDLVLLQLRLRRCSAG